MFEHLYQTADLVQREFDRAAGAYRVLLAQANEARECSWDRLPVQLAPYNATFYQLEQAWTKIGRGCVSAMIDLVATALGGGTALELPEAQDLLSGFFDEEGLPADNFSCRAMLDALLALYAPDAGQLRLQQIADRFVSAFRLRADEVPATRGGAVVLDLSMYLDSISLKHSHRQEYSNHEDLSRAARALAEVLGELDADLAHQTASHAAHVATVGRMNQWKPVRDLYGPIGPVGIKAYKGKVEFLVPQALAQRLNVFLSQHATKLLRQSV